MARAFSWLQATAIAGAIALVPASTAAMAAADSDTYRELDKFMEVFNRVKASYVDKVDDKALVRGAIDGMLASLDPHSSYVDAVDFQNMQILTTGNYGGAGPPPRVQGGRGEGVRPTGTHPP